LHALELYQIEDMPSGMQRPSIQSVARTVTSEDVAQGRILFLPPFHETPGNSVQRVFGKGPVDEGMFDRPVVICSRPADEGGVVHFHIVSSLAGRRTSCKERKVWAYTDVGEHTPSRQFRWLACFFNFPLNSKNTKTFPTKRPSRRGCANHRN